MNRSPANNPAALAMAITLTLALLWASGDLRAQTLLVPAAPPDPASPATATSPAPGPGPGPDPSTLSQLANQPADPASVEPNPDDPVRLRRMWEAHWYRFARRYALLDDQPILCATYDRRYPSSRGQSVQQVIETTAREVEVRIATNMTQRQRILMPRDEAEYLAHIIPALAVGQYGHIHSARVTRILGPDEMLLEDVWLIDANDLAQRIAADRAEWSRRARAAERARQNDRPNTRNNSVDLEDPGNDPNALRQAVDRRYGQRQKIADQQRERGFSAVLHVKGYDTTGLEPGKRWPLSVNQPPLDQTPPEPSAGPHIAIVAEVPMPSAASLSAVRSAARAPQTALFAVPASAFFRGLSEERFAQLLLARGIDRKAFVQLVTQHLVASPDTFETKVLDEIEAAAAALPTATAPNAPAAPATADPAAGDPTVNPPTPPEAQPVQPVDESKLPWWERRKLQKQRSEQPGSATPSDQPARPDSPDRPDPSAKPTDPAKLPWWERRKLEKQRQEKADDQPAHDPSTDRSETESSDSSNNNNKSSNPPRQDPPKSDQPDAKEPADPPLEEPPIEPG